MKTDMKTARKVLKEKFGFDDFRGYQEPIIRYTLQGDSSLVLMPTGMGKSLCFQLPSQILEGTTLVLSPLIALMKDQVDAAKRKGLRVCFINSSLSGSERNRRYKQLSEGKFDLVYVTPERFQKAEFRDALSKVKISLFAIDEAHCISQWGHDFRPDYTRVAEFRELMGFPTTMALTATATPEVQKDIIEQIGFKDPSECRVFLYGFEREELQLAVEEVYGLEDKVKRFVNLRSRFPGPTILYFSLIDSVVKFSAELDRLDIPHWVYHGKLWDKERRETQEAFMASKNGLILATPAFGLGVDKEDVRMVAHAEIPGSIESYYQEVGRAGRDGKTAVGTLFYDQDDLTIQMNFMKWSNPEPSFIRQLLRLIQDHESRVHSEGYEYLRGQLSFKNKSDFRVETALNLLARWECTEGTVEKKNIKAVAEPESRLMDEDLFEKRLKGQQRKLLECVKYAREKSCRKRLIYEYFGMKSSSTCGRCDNCVRKKKSSS